MKRIHVKIVDHFDCNVHELNQKNNTDHRDLNSTPLLYGFDEIKEERTNETAEWEREKAELTLINTVMPFQVPSFV
ncbi:hypothetical protein SDJN02_26532, partial [Cucurbita argyrosperma subsp. argyrosperma]